MLAILVRTYWHVNEESYCSINLRKNKDKKMTVFTHIWCINCTVLWKIMDFKLQHFRFL